MSRIYLLVVPLLIGIALISTASAADCFPCITGAGFQNYFNPAAGPGGPPVFPEPNFTLPELTIEDYQRAASMRAQRTEVPVPAWDRLPSPFNRPSLSERFSSWFTGS
ncbi:MAG: hypothetical protein WC382_01520 [Methanoregulaceae archaeon]|jgi:hypothetical protein